MSLIQTFANHPRAQVSTMPQVAKDGRRAWVRHHGDLGNRVAENGDLILDLKDIPEHDNFVNDGILDRWALANKFSVDGMHRTSALITLYMKTLHKLLGEVGADDPRIDAVSAILDGEPGATEHFRVRIDKTFVISVLTEAFDGPLGDEGEFLAAIERRLLPDAEWLTTGE